MLSWLESVIRDSERHTRSYFKGFNRLFPNSTHQTDSPLIPAELEVSEAALIKSCWDRKSRFISFISRYAL